MSNYCENPQNGNEEIKITSVRTPEKEKAIRCLRMSFLFPIIITLTFCGADIAVHYKICSESTLIQNNDFLKWVMGIDSLKIVLGYFSVTLITMALFMFIQQFYFKVYAGLDEDKAMTLLIIAVVYLIIYPVYISAFYDSYCMTLFECFATVFFGGYIWRSLNIDIRNLSVYPPHRSGPNAFISPNC